MGKKPYKVMVLSAIIAAMTAGSITPTYAAAAQTKQVQQATENLHEGYDLGPEGLKAAMTTTGSNALVVDLYALTIIKQGLVNFSNSTSVTDELKTKVANHQTTAKGNANYWLDTLKPNLINTNQGIINYNTRFQNYYDTMIDAVNRKDKTTLKSGLTNLTNNINKNKQQVDTLLADLKSFRDKLARDTQNFKGDTDTITSILAGQDSGIPVMQKELTAYTDSIDKNIGIIAGGSVGVVVGIGLVVAGSVVIATGAGAALGTGLIVAGVGVTAGGAAAVGVASADLDKAYKKIKQLTAQITAAQAEVTLLTNAKNQTTYLSNTIDLAITSVQNLSNQWHTMSAKYGSLLSDLDLVDANELSFVKEDLSSAKDSWSDVKAYADTLYKDIKFVDDKKM